MTIVHPNGAWGVKRQFPLLAGHLLRGEEESRESLTNGQKFAINPF